ncbi:MAG: hypothetical protein RL318_166, partial [Fibrobacterota bacterium]
MIYWKIPAGTCTVLVKMIESLVLTRLKRHTPRQIQTSRLETLGKSCEIAPFRFIMTSRFSSSEESIGNTTVLWLRHPDGRALAVLPQVGAAIHRLQLPAHGKAHDLLVPMRTEIEIQRNRWAKSAHLLPFPNRIHRGGYEFEGKRHQMPINFRPNGGHAIHGFAMGMPWKVDHQKLSSEGASLSLSLDCPDGQTGFPFPWRAELLLVLSESGFQMETRLINRGKRAMPAGWGWHPYFRTGSKIDDLELQLPKGRKLVVDEW